MRKLFILLLLIPLFSVRQNSPQISKDIIYYGKDFFGLEGAVIPDSLKRIAMIDYLFNIKI
ncbi:MAG: hypothetical protein CBB92_03900 [Flammeovirgaceae bacterium TMED32]|nr:MAG: hypothetical protein CBB92_03900 [Flammeovirgaceae bacterium TMED32]